MAFIIEKIDGLMQQKLFSPGVNPEHYPVDHSKLRLIIFNHYNFSNDVKVGKIIVHKKLAQDALNIFEELYNIKFPIHQAVTIDNYNYDDISSMEDNNSSGYNCRKILNTDKWSSHAFGAAIDINPLQNPYSYIDPDTGALKILPQAGSVYLNRNIVRPGMVELIVQIFTKNKFSLWGGSWEETFDYHHFQVPWDIIKGLR